MKLCKDCKHGLRDWLLGWGFAKCNAIKDPVLGRARWYCQTERNSAFDNVNKCGSQGKLWEKRTSLWMRLIALVRSMRNKA